MSASPTSRRGARRPHRRSLPRARALAGHVAAHRGALGPPARAGRDRHVQRALALHRLPAGAVGVGARGATLPQRPRNPALPRRARRELPAVGELPAGPRRLCGDGAGGDRGRARHPAAGRVPCAGGGGRSVPGARVQPVWRAARGADAARRGDLVAEARPAPRRAARGTHAGRQRHGAGHAPGAGRRARQRAGDRLAPTARVRGSRLGGARARAHHRP